MVKQNHTKRYKMENKINSEKVSKNNVAVAIEAGFRLKIQKYNPARIENITVEDLQKINLNSNYVWIEKGNKEHQVIYEELKKIYSEKIKNIQNIIIRGFTGVFDFINHHNKINEVKNIDNIDELLLWMGNNIHSESVYTAIRDEIKNKYTLKRNT